MGRSSGPEIAATLKGDYVIRRDSPWMVDANGNALKLLLALGLAWLGLAWLDPSLGPRPIGPTSGKQNSERI